MRQTIDFVPIYKGELNMTPQRFEGIKNAKIKARRRFQRVMSIIESTILIVASTYILASITVGLIR